MEVLMADTAVGLFAHLEDAEEVVNAIGILGFPADAIRVVAQPKGAAVDSATSTPQIDFAAALGRDLRSMGASDGDCEAFLAGIRRGNVLVFATGTAALAESAIETMNDHAAIEVEELVGAAPAATGSDIGAYVGGHDISSKASRERAKTEGAKVFSW
jgi:hypothetical protein